MKIKVKTMSLKDLIYFTGLTKRAPSRTRVEQTDEMKGEGRKGP